jgi:hypothetical protein
MKSRHTELARGETVRDSFMAACIGVRQLRTLQRRIREWRRVMARELVYACVNGKKTGAKSAVIGADSGAGPGQPPQ